MKTPEDKDIGLSVALPYMYPFFIIFFIIITFLLSVVYREDIDNFLRSEEDAVVIFIFMIIFILFLIFSNSYCVGRFRVKSLKVKSLTELIEEMAHFEQGSVEKNVTIKKDGSCIMESVYEIVGVTGAIEERTFRHKALTGSKFEDANVEIKAIEMPTETELITQKIDETRTLLIYNVSFHPGLKSGHRAKILLKEKFSKFFKMKRSEVKRLIKEGNWEFKKPYEYTAMTIPMKTEKANISVIFPENWIIPLKDIKFDVTVGLKFQRDWSEYLKIKQESGFKVKKERNRIKVDLSVSSPVTGSNYWILWLPKKGDSNKQE